MLPVFLHQKKKLKAEPQGPVQESLSRLIDEYLQMPFGDVLRGMIMPLVETLSGCLQASNRDSQDRHHYAQLLLLLTEISREADYVHNKLRDPDVLYHTPIQHNAATGNVKKNNKNKKTNMNQLRRKMLVATPPPFFSLSWNSSSLLARSGETTSRSSHRRQRIGVARCTDSRMSAAAAAAAYSTAAASDLTMTRQPAATASPSRLSAVCRRPASR